MTRHSALFSGLNPKIIEEAIEIGFPFFPGVMTPSDIELANYYGIKVLKFFPAEAAGGVKYLKSLVAPYTHTGIKFIPTGGVNLNNVSSYIELDSVIAVGGTWIAKKEDISMKKWNKIKQNCRDCISLIQRELPICEGGGESKL